MAEIKLKVIGAAVDTLAVSRAGSASRLCIQPPTRTAIGFAGMRRAGPVLCGAARGYDAPGTRIHQGARAGFSDSARRQPRKLQSAQLYRHLPSAARPLATAEEIAAAETSRSTPTTARQPRFLPAPSANVKPAARPCLPPATPWTAFMRMTPTAHGPTRAGASTATPTPRPDHRVWPSGHHGRAASDAARRTSRTTPAGPRPPWNLMTAAARCWS